MTALVWPEPLRQGDPRQVGDFRLKGRLGGGGMGQVFLGHSPGGRPVAVKLVRPELADDPGFRRRFAIEVEAARRVGGFYTAQVVDADPNADPPRLVTAYIPGPSLHEAVETHGPLPEEAITLLGAGLAEGLGAIHVCGLVHRDLKPSNVILAADGPRVIDFGITRALDATSHTLSRSVVGTPSFMSPEQARGHEVGPSSDVFSLGLVLAFAATGRSPFGTGSAEAIVYRIVHDEPGLTGLSAQLADLVKRCLAKDPGDRPGVTDILEELTNPTRTTTQWLPPPITTMIAERQVQTPPAPAPTNTQARHDGPPMDRGSVTPEQFSSGTAAAAPEIAEILRRTGPPSHTHAEPGPAPESPESGERRRPGRRTILLGGVAAAAMAVPAVVFWPGDKKGPGQQSGSGKAPGMSGSKGPTAGTLKGKVPVVVAAYNPDGGTVAASSYRASTDGSGNVGDSGCVQLWDMATRRLSTLTLGSSDFLPNAVAFSPDGRTLAVGSDGSDSVTLWNMATGRVLVTLKRDWDFGYEWSRTNSLTFSPNGKTLAVSGQDLNPAGEGHIRLWDLSGRRPVATALEGKHKGPFYQVAFSPDGRSIAASGYSGVRLWDRSIHRVTLVRDSPTVTNAVAFSPDSKTLASCDGLPVEGATSSERGGIWLWDVSTGRSTTLTEEIVYSVAFSPDGKSLASAGEDGLKVWNVATGRASALDDSTHYWLTLSPDGKTLATAAARHSTDIQLWKLP